MKLMSCVHQAAHSTLCACFVRYWYARVRSFPACLLSLCVSLVASVRVRAVLVVYLYKIYKVGRSTVRSRSRGGGLELYYASYHPLQTSVPATARFRSPITVRRRRHPEGLQHCNCYHPTDRQPSRDPAARQSLETRRGRSSTTTRSTTAFLRRRPFRGEHQGRRCRLWLALRCGNRPRPGFGRSADADAAAKDCVQKLGIFGKQWSDEACLVEEQGEGRRSHPNDV